MKNKIMRKWMCVAICTLLILENGMVVSAEELAPEQKVQSVAEITQDDFLIDPLKKEENKIFFHITEKESFAEKNVQIENIYAYLKTDTDDSEAELYRMGYQKQKGYYFEVDVEQINAQTVRVQPIVTYGTRNIEEKKETEEFDCEKIEEDELIYSEKIELDDLILELNHDELEEGNEKEEGLQPEENVESEDGMQPGADGEEVQPEEDIEDEKELESGTEAEGEEEINPEVEKEVQSEEDIENEKEPQSKVNQKNSNQISEIVEGNEIYANSVANVQVMDLDGEQKKYEISVTKTSYKKLKIAVWSEANGQDDLIWYPAVEKEGIYKSLVEIKKHASTGKYAVHVYGSNTNESWQFVGGTSFIINPPKEGKISTKKTENGFQVQLSGVDSPSGISKIRAAVWCNENQSDLVWKSAENRNGVYSLDVNVAEHRMLSGVYKVHFYATDGNGFESYCGGTKEEVEVKENRIIVQNKDGKQKTYTIELKSAAYTNVMFAVWSDVNGQDDLKWYTGKRVDGVLEAQIDIKKHGSTGVYYVHAYGSKSGVPYFVNGTKFEVKSPNVGKVSTELTQAGFKTVVSSVASPSGIKEVRAAVWHKADQSDLKWKKITGEKEQYVFDVNAADYKNAVGEYNIHVYVEDGNGILTFGKGMRVNVGPRAKNLKATITSAGCEFEISGVESFGNYQNVSIALWSEKNGQDDLKWYNTKKSGSIYKILVPEEKMLDNGTYYAHAYMKNTAGESVFLCGTEIKLNRKTVLSLKTESVNNSKGTIKLTADIQYPGYGIKKVHVAVWNNKKSSDVRWYDMSKGKDGKYTTSVDISKHGYMSGEYTVHGYILDTSGVEHFFSGTTFKIELNNLAVYQKQSAVSGIVKIYGANVQGKTPESVRMATWSSEGNQDDIRWTDARKGTNGEYYVNVTRSDFKRSGEFVTHIYGYINGQAHYIGGVKYTMSSSKIFDSYAQTVMHNIIFAVETGGQIYGNAQYDCFAPAYNLTQKETAITIGAGGWFATQAQNLLKEIRKEDLALFKKLDTEGIGKDLDTQNWQYYGSDGKGNVTIPRGSKKAVCIQKLISSEAGIRVQNRLVDEQMIQYVNEARREGVDDLKAQMFCANIRHLGGKGAMVRVIDWCKSDNRELTMRNIYNSMREHTTDKNGNGVGANKYNTRHVKVMGWIDQYI